MLPGIGLDFRDLLDKVIDAIFVFDRGGRCCYANAAAERLADTEPLIGRRWDEVAPFLQTAHVADALRDAKLVELGHVVELLHPNHARCFEARFRALDGDLVMVTCRDVSSRKELEITYADLWRLLDVCPWPALQWEMSGTIYEANPAFLQLVGYTREDLVHGRIRWEAMTPPEWRAADERALEQLRTRGWEDPYEKEYVRKDGSRVPVLLAGALVSRASHRGLSFAVDLAPLKALEEANRIREEFLAMMSHELRTPLNAILGWATLLRQDSRDEARLGRGLEVIERNARTQERLVSDLLDMARFTSGKLKLTFARTSLREIASTAAESMRTLAEAKGVRMIVNIDHELPSLVGDIARLQQVVGNILSNAVRHTPPGGRITITGERCENGVRVRIKDTGQGIEPSHLARIFERSRQVDTSTTRAHGGLGLGLTIARHLLEAHGGHVEAHSDGPGRGAAFTVTLPVRAVDTSLGPFSDLPSGGMDDTAAPRPLDAIAADVDLADVRILVVDDDRDSRDLLGILLEAAGAKVTAASTAREALAERGPFDVIVSDIGMPEIDGYSMVEQLRSREAGTPVPAIALTAYVGQADVHRAARAGFAEHIAKPVDAAKLLEAVHRWSRPRASQRPVA